ncbi:sensor histidine kinase [Dehalococcoides mccartyi]|jgi:PAS domain S-box-containing protein|uniref:histidine kinase n=1 Tax=Dehalococcoides mccartyi (strain CBDB1) TaxID=255470 RepID=A0A916KN80_DEHMC|nr:PAS domain-containing sensor histidine kinase [Dehalococcoides mccartyi]AII61464.1 ATPase [Dehalococcoides mccartyi CG5]CAI83567.1 sensor histidine kinase [Dehalococcoides mccartyi CBDB1]
MTGISNSFFRLILDNSTTAVCLLNEQGKLVYSNKALSDLTGYNLTELANMNVNQICTTLPIPQWHSHWDKLKIYGTAIRISVFLSKRGIRIPVEITDTYLKYLDIECICLFIRNINLIQKNSSTITAHQNHLTCNCRYGETLSEKPEILPKMAHTQTKNTFSLKDDKRIFNVIFNNASDAIILWEAYRNKRDSVVLEVNDKACQRFEYTREEMIGKPIPFFQPHSDASESMLSRAMDADLGGEGATYELQHKSKSGKILQHEVNAHQFEINGKMVFLSIIRDISLRKEFETKLQDMYEKEKALNLQLENEFKKRTEFTRILIHELKTPLTPIVAASDMLLKILPSDDTHALAYQINKGAEELENRMNDLFDLVRGELGILTLNTEKVDCGKLLSNIVEYVQPQVQSKNQSLEFVVQHNLPAIEADPLRLKQIIMNVLGNSLKFTPRNGTIKLNAFSEENSLIIRIEDTGLGISKDKQKRLLMAYNDKLTAIESSGGLGLGLALSKTFVDLHHGQIKISSQEGYGTICDIILPLNRNF